MPQSVQRPRAIRWTRAPLRRRPRPQATAEPTAQAQGVDAKELADSFIVDIEDNDGDQVRQLVALLGDDPAYLAAFFEELGPANTVAALKYLGGDPALLGAYDRALADATRDPGWDTAFTKDLFDPGYVDRQYLLPELLQDGVFSQDFLTRASDLYLFGAWSGEPALSDHARTLFDALARNPDAAYAYLMGRAPDSRWGHDGASRLWTLLGGNPIALPAPDLDVTFALHDAFPNLGGALLQADLSPQAGDHTQLLEALGNLSWEHVPDGVRGSIAELLAGHLDLVKDAPGNTEAPNWKQNLFIMAELNGNAHVDEGRVRELQDGVAQWATQSAAQLRGSDADGITNWLSDFGNLAGLSQLGLHDSPYYQAQMAEMAKQSREQMLTMLAAGGLALGPEAEGATFTVRSGIEVSKALGAEMAKGAILDHLGSDAPPWVTDHEAYAETLANMRTAAVSILYAKDQSWLPADLQGLPASDPKVAGFLVDIAGARSLDDLPKEYRGDPNGPEPPWERMIEHLETFKSHFDDQQLSNTEMQGGYPR